MINFAAVKVKGLAPVTRYKGQLRTSTCGINVNSYLNNIYNMLIIIKITTIMTIYCSLQFRNSRERILKMSYWAKIKEVGD